MAGRGRELTLPAWMKKQQSQAPPAASAPASVPYTASAPPVAHQFANAPEPTNGRGAPEESSSARGSHRSRSRDRDSSSRRREKERSHRSSRSRRSRDRSSRDRDRSRSRSRDRGRHRERSDRRGSSSRRSRSRSGSPSSPGHERRRRRKSNFDVRPPGVTDENAAAYAAQAILQQSMAALSGAVGPASFGPPPPMGAPPSQALPPQGGYNHSHNRGPAQHMHSHSHSHAHSHISPAHAAPFAAGHQQTRHARRIYVGGIGDVVEHEITAFFNDVIDRALGETQEGGAVVSVYINRERHFAFVELKSIELTTACMNLDGVAFRGQPLKIRRPNDYNPATVPKDLGPIPQLNLAALGIVSTTVQDSPNKIFVGGIPYHLNDEQVKELLQAFGALKSFHLVKELNTNMSKGYGFCEYQDPSVTDAACIGLNDMKLGDKTLTVRRAMSQENAKAVASAAGSVNSALSMGLDPTSAALQTMSMAAGYGGMGGMLASGPAGTPSRVIMLLNMVTPEELEDEEEYVDIMDDIKSECERFGSVLSLVIPRPRDGIEGAVGKVFVEFGDVASAQGASKELHGRGFANRTVAVEFMEEDKYARRDFS